jgi:hypothetical protein
MRTTKYFYKGENTLPCAIIKTHGKQDLCRAFSPRRTTNNLFGVRFFFCRALYKKTHGKQAICRAPEIKRTAKVLTHGKHGFSRCDYHVDLLDIISLLLYGEVRLTVHFEQKTCSKIRKT